MFDNKCQYFLNISHTSGTVKSIYTSTLIFDIVQFFSFLNHQLFLMILNKVGLNTRISSSYLINKQTQYM